MKYRLPVLFLVLLTLLASCEKAAKVEPLAQIGEPQAILAVMNSDLGDYKIKYFQPAQRDQIPSATQSIAGSPVKETDEPFAVLEHGPVDELPAEIKKPTIYVVFSQPVVPLAKLGQVMKSSDILKIEPPLEGIYRWYGSKMLAFESDTDALPQKRYQISVDPGLKSLGGKGLTGETRFTFHTEYAAMLNLTLGDKQNFINLNDAPLEPARRILVHFNCAVDTAVVEPSLQVSSAGRNYPFAISHPENPDGKLSADEVNRNLILVLKDPVPENAEFTVLLMAGAQVEKDGLATVAPQELKFHTLLPFSFQTGDTYSYSFPMSKKGDSNPIFLKFSHPLVKEGLAAKIQVNPPLPIKDSDIEVWGTTIKVDNLPVKYDTTYVFTLGASIKDIYGRSLGQSIDYKLHVGNPFRYAYFPNHGYKMLESQFPPKIVWEEQDVPKGTWKVGPLEDPYATWKEGDLAPFDFSKVKAHTKHFEVVDLAPFLNKEGKGTVGLAWNLYQNMNYAVDQPRFSTLTVQVTDLGLTVRYGYNKVVALVTRLSTGNAVSGAKVSLLADRREVKSQTTDNDGLAEFDIDEGQAVDLLHNDTSWGENGSFRVRVEKDSDKIEFRPNNSHDLWHNGVWAYSDAVSLMNTRSQQTFFFSDRKIYRPGETMSYRGIDRTLHLGKYSSYEGDYRIRLISPFGERQTVVETKARTTSSGGFSGTSVLPSGLEPGDYILEYGREGAKEKITTPITVNFFRRLLFSTNLTKADRPYFAGDTLNFKLGAEYLSGGALAGGTYSGYWNKEPSWFRPEGARWNGYVFGPGSTDERYSLSNFQGSLSASGSAELKQATTPEGVLGLPYTYNIGVNVTDTASNQLMSASDSVFVHPALFYLGVRIKNAGGSWTDYFEKGQDLSVEVNLVRPDGTDFAPQGTKVNAEFHFVEWKEAQQQGVNGVVETRWNQVDKTILAKTWQPGGSTETMGFKPDKEGMYYVLLKADDPAGRTAVTKRSFYVTGSEWIRWYRQDDADLGLKADQEIYNPGDTAKVLLQSPLPEGTYLMTVEREGIYEKKLFHVKGSTSVLEVPIKEEYLPIVYVAVSSFSTRSGPPSSSYYEPDLGKPKGYFGITPLRIESTLKKINLVITPDQKTYRPGTEAEVTVQAFNRGQPLADAEITFMAVDRGVVDLINYHVPDPMKFFYDPEKFPLGTRGADSRSLLIDPVTYQVKDLPGGDSDDTKFSERKDFRPTAVFEPYLKTDGQGRVKVKFKLPDSLTTYRTTAVAVKGDLFGLSEGDLRIQNPINLRAALPRKLRLRDTSYSGVIVTNLDDKARKVTVAASSDLVTIDKETSKTVTVESGQTVEVAFKLAAEKAGLGEFVFTMTSDLVNEKVRQPIEVEQPYIFESVATLGKVTDADTVKDKDGKPSGLPFAEEGIILPSSAPEGQGNLTLTLDSTRIGNLQRAFAYTFDYPYGCLEQRSSRLLPLVVFGDFIKTFGIDSKVVDPRKTVQDELAYILKNQNSDGGFPVWPGYGTNYYVSIRVAHILWYALQNGYEIPDGYRIDHLLDYLASDLDKDTYWPKGDWLKLYSLYVQSLHGRSIVGRLGDFAAKEDKLGLLGYGMLGLAYDNLGQRDKATTILQRMKNFLRPSTRSVDLTDTEESPWSGFEIGSGVAKLSVLLMLMQKLEPGTDMVQRVVTSLTDRQKAGVWHNTDDTNWALQALAQVIKAEERDQPNFQAKATLDGQTLVSQAFQGIGAVQKETVLPFTEPPLKTVARDTLKALHLEKDGPGTLFYSALLRYSIPSETAVPRDEGLGLFTEITDLDGNPPSDGKTLTVGQIYKMKVTLTSSKDRAWVAVRVPVPSGAEILDSKLRTGALLVPKPGKKSDSEEDRSGRLGPAEHQEIYDNEVRFFFDAFTKGSRQVEFLFRAVSQGVYPVPPATAECMYEPEIFGRDLGRLLFLTRKP